MASFHIRYYRHGEAVLVRVEGALIAGTAASLLRPVLSLFKKGVHQVIIDLSVATSIDGAGLDTLEEIASVLHNLDRPPLSVVVKPKSRLDFFLQDNPSSSNITLHASTDDAFHALNQPPLEKTEAAENLSEDDIYLTFRKYTEGEVVIYEIDGELDIEEVQRFKKRLKKELNEGARKLVLDMKEIRFVDSSALGLFVRLRDNLTSVGGDLRFARLSPQAERVFTVFRLPHLFKIYPSVEQAVASYKPISNDDLDTEID